MNPRRSVRRPVARSRVSIALRHGLRNAVLVVAALGPVTLDSACWGTPNVGFELSIPPTISAAVAWIEIGAFPQGACPTASELAGGVPLAGTVARVVFQPTDTSPPAFGDLPRGTYGFAAVARDFDCAVIGEGCSVVDVGSASNIAIDITPISSPAGACEMGSACIDAVCVEQGDAGPGAPSGCSLAFVGGGPLGDPLGYDTSRLLSAPSIVATDSGFLLAYREFLPEPPDGCATSTATARMTLIAIDDSGGSSPPQQWDLEDRCSESPETDATALAWNGSAGVVAVSRQTCPTSPPGVDIFAVDAQGAKTQGGFSPTGVDAVTLSQAHALAYTTSGLLLATVNSDTQVAAVTVVNGTSLGPATSTFPFGDLTSTLGAYVTATSLGTGLLSLGSPSVTSDASDAAPDPPVPTSDGGLPFYTASFTGLGAGGRLGKLPSPNDFSASWVSMSGVDNRILVATNGAGASNPIVWYAYDIGEATPAAVHGFAPQAMGDIAYADVALHADNAFFAVQVGNSVALLAFRKASTYPELLTEYDFAGDARIPIGSVRDGLVAVTADATRVAVVWGTGKTVTDDEDLGGYAVFACAP
jgi:hypothetical protein